LRLRAKAAAERCQQSSRALGNSGEQRQSLEECVATAIFEDVKQVSERNLKLNQMQDIMASRLRNYTCADDSMETSESISQWTFESPSFGKTHVVNDLLLAPRARIWYVQDFVSAEDCSILMRHGAPRLRRATVAAEDGSSIVSENRKAQQASYSLGGHGDPLGYAYAYEY
jgi:GAF domain-containing protein